MLGFASYAAAPFAAIPSSGALLSSSFSDGAVADVAKFIASKAFLAVVSDSATASSGVFSAAAAFGAAISDAVAATAAATAAHGVAASVSEASSISSAAVAQLAAAVQISETAYGAVAATVEPSVFGAVLSDAVTSEDALAPLGVYNASFADDAIAADMFAGDYLWKIINDSQATDWALVKTQS